jgi:hypothetical protein
MADYLGGARLRARLDNLARSTMPPAAAVGLGWQGQPVVLARGLTWPAPIGIGRVPGCGRKYGDRFQHTHLGRLGRRDPDDPGPHHGPRASQAVIPGGVGDDAT